MVFVFLILILYTASSVFASDSLPFCSSYLTDSDSLLPITVYTSSLPPKFLEILSKRLNKNVDLGTANLISVNLTAEQFSEYCSTIPKEVDNTDLRLISAEYIPNLQPKLVRLSNYHGFDIKKYKIMLQSKHLPQSEYCLPGILSTDILIFDNYFSGQVLQNNDWLSFDDMTKALRNLPLFKKSLYIPAGDKLAFMRLLSTLFYSYNGGTVSQDGTFNINRKENIQALELLNSWFNHYKKPIASLDCFKYTDANVINGTVKRMSVGYLSTKYLFLLEENSYLDYSLLPSKHHASVMEGYCYTVINNNIHNNNNNNQLNSKMISYLQSLVDDSNSDSSSINSGSEDLIDDESSECDFIPYGFTSFVQCNNDTVFESSNTAKIMKKIIGKSQSISLLSHFTKYYSQAIDLIYNKISYMIITNNTNYNYELSELQKNLEELLKAENDTSIDVLYIPAKIETIESETGFDFVNFILGLLLGLIASLLILFGILQTTHIPVFGKRRTATVVPTSFEEMTKVSSFIDHEIRNILTAIIGIGEYLSDNVLSIQECMKPKFSSIERDKRVLSLERNVASLNNACELLTDVVNNGMDIRKLQEGKLLANPVPYRFSDLVERVFHILQPKIAELPDVRCFYKLFDRQGWYIFDKHRVQQVLTNLLTVALTSTSVGSINVKVVEEGYNRIKISVEDTGRGIPKEKLDTIFDSPFAQDQNNFIGGSGSGGGMGSIGVGGVGIIGGSSGGNSGGSSTENKNLGLALYLCKILVKEVLKGEIGCQSTENVGTLFYFIFPVEKCQEPPEEKGQMHQTVQTADMSKKHILIIDDSQLSRKIVLKALKLCNATGDEACDGTTALKLVQNNHYDAIITDLNMPQITGYELAKLLRKNLNYLGPIITLTGENPKEIYRVCKEAGIDEIATKPLQPRELVHIVMELIQRYKSHSPFCVNKSVNIEELLPSTKSKSTKSGETPDL